MKKFIEQERQTSEYSERTNRNLIINVTSSVSDILSQFNSLVPVFLCFNRYSFVNLRDLDSCIWFYPIPVFKSKTSFKDPGNAPTSRRREGVSRSRVRSIGI